MHACAELGDTRESKMLDVVGHRPLDNILKYNNPGLSNVSCQTGTFLALLLQEAACKKFRARRTIRLTRAAERILRPWAKEVDEAPCKRSEQKILNV